MKKIFLIFLILIISISSVSAISILSSSQIDFDSNNPLYAGPAFVVLGVENGGRDLITWSMYNFAEELDNDYTMTRSGTISSEFETEGWTYPTDSESTVYGAKEIGAKWTLYPSSWCNDLGGNLYITKTNAVYFSCIKIYPIGYFHSLKTGEYDYNVEYTLDINNVGSDKFVLTETNPTGGRMIGDKNWFQAIRQTDGVSRYSDPDIDDKMWLYWDLGAVRWNTILPVSEPNRLSYYSVMNHLLECPDLFGVGDIAKQCLDRLDNERNNIINYRYFSDVNVFGKLDSNGNIIQSSVPTEISNEYGQGVGAVTFDNGNIYRNPIVTLTINADKLGVYRSFGKADIINIDYPLELKSGTTDYIDIKVKELGMGDMDAIIEFNCRDFSISGFNPRFSLDKGETKTISGRISFTGNTIGCNDFDCTLTVGNTNAVGIDDSYKIDINVCPPSECAIEGSSICFGNILRVCTNVNGVLKYGPTVVCENGCKIDGNTAYCLGELGYCGDGICGLDEGGVKETVASCREDCYIPPPPLKIDWVLVGFVAIGSILILVAGYLRLKKDGYFN